MTTEEMQAEAEDAWAELQASAAKWLAIALAVAGVVALLATFIAHTGWEARGQAGDFFGGHLSGFGNVAAFLLMFAALTLQRRELALQRRELILSRAEAAEQTKALEEQHEALVRAYEAADRQAAALLETHELQRRSAERTRLRELREDAFAFVEQVADDIGMWDINAKGFPAAQEPMGQLRDLQRRCQEEAAQIDELLLDPSPDPPRVHAYECQLAKLRTELMQLGLALDAARNAPRPKPDRLSVRSLRRRAREADD